MHSEQPDRYERGWKRLREVDGEVGERVIGSLQDVAPDLGRYIVEFAFGDIYMRAGLDLQQRQLVTVAALTALGGCEAQLEVKVKGALNLGISPEQVVEAIMQCLPYAGFPRVLNAIYVVKKVLAEPTLPVR